MRRALVWPLLVLVGSCAKATEPTAAPGVPPPPVEMMEPQAPAYEGTNPVDGATHALFWKNKHAPVEAPRAELCRRLFADLLGKYPTEQDVAQTCEGRDLGVIIRDLQSRDAYINHSQRFWRDRFQTNDVEINWRYIKGLYELTEALHKGRLGYGDFITKAGSHPGFIMSELQPDDRARLAFRAFLGREATDAEAADFASLYRAWIPVGEMDPEFRYSQWNRAYVFPFVCQPVLHCKAEFLGGGEVDLRGSGTMQIAYEDLRDWQLEQLEEPGRVLARQPIVWEAAADFMLNRFLGWSDGGRTPREPGILLPEVRQALAEYLMTTGDYAGAEYQVLSSWLYIQPTEIESDGFGDDDAAPSPPIWANGPVKAAMAEAWLHSAEPLFGPFGFGECDPRYTDSFVYFQLFQAAQNATVAPSVLEMELQRVADVLGDRRPFRVDEQSGLRIPDFRFSQVARLIGGCPGFQNLRAEPNGMAFAYTQESLAELICQPNVALNAPPLTDPTVENIVTHQMKLLFGREPVEAEVQAFSDARANCTGNDCTVQATINSVCVALLGSAEMLFY